MPLSDKDFEAILDGTAHTWEASSNCSNLIRMSWDALKSVMTNVMPCIVAKRDGRVLQACLHLRELIANWANNSEILTATLKLDVSVPFQKRANEIIAYSGNILSNTMNQEEKTKKMNILTEERIFLRLNSDDPSFSRFHWVGGAHILRMNGTLKNKLSLSYEETLCYISMIIEATIYCISKWEQSNKLVTIDQERLSTMKKWMDIVFVYQENSYRFDLNDSIITAVPEALFTAIAALLSLHVPWKQKVIQIEEKDGNVEISWILKRNKKIPEGKEIWIWDLKDSSYYGSVDGSYFLNWLASSLPDTIGFRVENERLIFSIKPSWYNK